MYYQGRAKKPEDFEKWAAKHHSLMASVLDEDLLQVTFRGGGGALKYIGVHMCEQKDM